MRAELLEHLRRAARRQLAVRAAESGAVAACGAGAASVLVTAAWVVAPASRAAAVVLCLLAVPGAMVVLVPAARRALGLDRDSASLCVLLPAICGVLGAAMILRGGEASVARWLVAAVPAVAAAAVGAAVRLLRGVSLREAGLFLDLRFDLKERLATGAELAAAGREDPAAAVVYEQAVGAFRGGLARGPVWTRGRRTAAALALVVLAGASLAAIPSAAGAGGVSARAAARLDRIGRQFAAMDSRQRAELAERLRQAAGAAVAEGALAESLRSAAAAAANGDAAKLLDSVTAARLTLQTADRQAQAGVEAALAQGERQTGDGDQGDTAAGTTAPAPGGDGGPQGAACPPWAYVWDPAYARAGADTEPAEAPTASSVPAAGFLTYDQAWRAAQDRAAQALAGGKVPARYRRLVRDFFLKD